LHYFFVACQWSFFGGQKSTTSDLEEVDSFIELFMMQRIIQELESCARVKAWQAQNINDILFMEDNVVIPSSTLTYETLSVVAKYMQILLHAMSVAHSSLL
jgi:hypothetical protein